MGLLTEQQPCHCHAGAGGEVVLILPDRIFNMTGRSERTVSIDPCIASTLTALWDAGIITLGCCCGHNKTNPSIVIGGDYKDSDIPSIKNIIAECDDRKWDIQQWRLVTLETEGES